MARGPSKKEWYDRVPRDKEQLKDFNELQYLEVLRTASARQHPAIKDRLTLKGIAGSLGIPLKKLKQFMQAPDGFTMEMARLYAEAIKVPANVLNRIGRSLFKAGDTPEEKSPRTRGKNDANTEDVDDTPVTGKRPTDDTDFEALRKKAKENEKKRNNPFDKGPIDLDLVKRITFVSYLDDTYLAICHLEDDGTLKISLIPSHINDVNTNPWTHEILPGEKVPLIQAVPFGKKEVQVTESHVPIRIRKQR